VSARTPILTRKRSQRELVLSALRSAGDAGICVSELPTALSYTARNRISSLRREYVIRGERCTVHKHRGQVERYFLEAACHSLDGLAHDRSRTGTSVPEFSMGASPTVGGAVVHSTPVQMAML
jgi:hypothetical protein